MEDPFVHEPDIASDVSPDVSIHDLIVFETPAAPPPSLTTFPPPAAAAAVPGSVAPPTEPVRERSRLREWAESLLSTIVFVLLFTSFVAQATQVPTESMKPTIFVGDHFFLDKVAFPGNFPAKLRPYLPRREIRRHDIIAFKSPVDVNIPFVKRVIGLPGDTLEIRDKIVIINGRQTVEPYKIFVDPTIYERDSWTPEDLSIRDNYGPVIVPPDQYFVMGDNRDNSNDSRYWGFVTRDSIIGKPLFVYWSYESDPYVGGQQTIREWLLSYLAVGEHFFTRTRWFRTGTLVE